MHSTEHRDRLGLLLWTNSLESVFYSYLLTTRFIKVYSSAEVNANDDKNDNDDVGDDDDDDDDDER